MGRIKAILKHFWWYLDRICTGRFLWDYLPKWKKIVFERYFSKSLPSLAACSLFLISKAFGVSGKNKSNRSKPTRAGMIGIAKR